MPDNVVLVNSDDEAIGVEEKKKCHLPNGKLHRAFTSCLFNNDGRLLITKRSSNISNN